MTDIVKRLRAAGHNALMDEAAEEIDRLRDALSPKLIPEVKPTKRQLAVLRGVPNEFERFQRQRGIPYLVANPTISALVKKGLIEIDTMPPRWRKTPAGRVAAFTLSPGLTREGS